MIGGTPKSGWPGAKGEPAAGARARMVDARGHRCPVPTLRLRKALDAVGEGEEVVVLADDPLAKIDLPHFAAANGHEVIELSVEAWGLRARVRKGRHPGT